MIIGEKIKEGRKKYRTPEGKRLTQEGLAEMLNYKRETVNTWENGKVLPPLDVLFKLCEIFNCELGCLLGEPGYENGTRQETDIVNETGLTEEAAHTLQEYKQKNAEAKPIDLNSGSVMSNNAQNALDLKKYTQPTQFIPELISHMLTSRSFNTLVSRICAQNQALWEYSTLPDVEKEIITNAYKIALNRIGSSKADNTMLLESEYRRAVYDYMLENEQSIQNRLPYSFTSGAYKTIYADKLRSHFYLAHMTSERTEEMNTFLNSRDLFNIVSEFMEPITQFKD